MATKIEKLGSWLGGSHCEFMIGSDLSLEVRWLGLDLRLEARRLGLDHCSEAWWLGLDHSSEAWWLGLDLRSEAQWFWLGSSLRGTMAWLGSTRSGVFFFFFDLVMKDWSGWSDWWKNWDLVMAKVLVGCCDKRCGSRNDQCDSRELKGSYTIKKSRI